MRVLLSAVVMMAFTGLVAAEEKKDEKLDAKKLIGKWETAKPKKDEPAEVIEFTEKGELIMHPPAGGKGEPLKGTYKLEGNKLLVTLKLGDDVVKETMTISKLTDDELVSKDSKGKEDTLKKIKAK
ncbi:MAG: TIGR03066 family protein [Planctomycetes bacterium]|nr:TIGR03066 family protein [Planctomycetota bacterium]